MGRARVKEIPADIAVVRDRIEHWRLSRGKRTAMPQELWGCAVSLVGDHTIYRVSQNLRLNYTMLKRRVAESASAKAERVNHIEEVAVAAPINFVEVDGSQFFGASGPSENVVELVGVDGCSMIIRLPASAPLDVVGLAATFWRRS